MICCTVCYLYIDALYLILYPYKVFVFFLILLGVLVLLRKPSLFTSYIYHFRVSLVDVIFVIYASFHHENQSGKIYIYRCNRMTPYLWIGTRIYFIFIKYPVLCSAQKNIILYTGVMTLNILLPINTYLTR